MARCYRTRELQVHHISRDGGNSLDNAEVLCPNCHEATSSYGTPGKTSPDFDQETKDKAMKHAGNQCQCTRLGGCH